MSCSMPGSPVLHYLLELAQIYVHWVGEERRRQVMLSNHLILSCLLLLLPSIFPSIWIFSKELALCIKWSKCWNISCSISPVNIQGWFPLGLTGLIFLQSKGPSRGFSSITIPNHQLLSLLFGPTLTCIHTWLLEKPELWLYGSLSAKWCLCFLICCLGLS